MLYNLCTKTCNNDNNIVIIMWNIIIIHVKKRITVILCQVGKEMSGFVSEMCPHSPNTYSLASQNSP